MTAKEDSEAENMGKDIQPSPEVMEQHLRTYGTMDQFMSPGYWEQEIVLLYLAGKNTEAWQHLKLFKEAFPEYNTRDLEAMLASQ